MIEVEKLVYEYPGARALHELSFVLPKRSITALVGPNGAGKTTLLRCLAALEEPFSGNIRIAGVDVQRDPRTAHAVIGYLPDDFGLYRDLTLYQCLLYAGRSRGVMESALPQRIEEVIEQLGLSAKLPEKTSSLSRGQRQRLAIAQAIIHRPRVLLLDEPASGLDPESRAGLSSLMRSLGESGMTLVVSSHILAELEEYCTAMLVLQQGRVIEHHGLAHTTAMATRHIQLRLAQPSERLPDALRIQAGVTGVQAESAAASFEFSGDDQALSTLLATLVAQGLAPCEFAAEQLTLQDAYLSAVTKARSAT